MMRRIIFLILIPLFSYLSGYLFAGNVLGATTSTIDAKIKISVCGNTIAEGGEECDTADLKGATCTTLGYHSGTLACDIACSFNTTACIPFLPSPTPTPTSLPFPTSANTSQNVYQSSAQTQTSSPIQTHSFPPSIPSQITQSQSVFTHTITQFLQAIPQSDKNQQKIKNIDIQLLRKLIYLGADPSGMITRNSVQKVSNVWVSYRQRYLQGGSAAPCDLDNNTVCDIVDFSILMYYVAL